MVQSLLACNGKLSVFVYQTIPISWGSTSLRLFTIFAIILQSLRRLLANGWQPETNNASMMAKKTQREKEREREGKKGKSLHKKYFIWYLYVLGQLLLSVCRFVHYIEYGMRFEMCPEFNMIHGKESYGRTSFAEKERKNGPRVSLLHLCVPARKYIEAHAHNIHIRFATHIYYFIIIVIIIISIVCMHDWNCV